jgi:outer membrane lipoprotein SlyB
MTARALLLALLGAAVSSALPAAAQISPADAACGNCGVVQSIAPVSERQQWTPLGSIPEAGAMGGGPAGQPGSATMLSIGPGFTNRGMVVVGAAGGAAYAQKPNAYQRQRWDVTVKMDSGPPPRVINLSYEPFVQEGDRVRVFGNQLELVNP